MVPLLPLYFHCDLIFFDYISHMFFSKPDEVLFCLTSHPHWCNLTKYVPNTCVYLDFAVVCVKMMGYHTVCWLVWLFGSVQMIPRTLKTNWDLRRSVGLIIYHFFLQAGRCFFPKISSSRWFQYSPSVPLIYLLSVVKKKNWYKHWC